MFKLSEQESLLLIILIKAVSGYHKSKIIQTAQFNIPYVEHL